MRLLPIAIAAATLLLVACTSSSGSTETPTETDAPDTTEATATATPTGDDEDASDDFPEMTPFADGLEAKLHEIRDKVAEIRGLPIHPTAKEGIVSTEALAQYGRDQYGDLEEDEAEDVAASEALMSLLGLAPPGYSLEDYASESANIIAGVYYFEADRLVLVGEAPDELTVTQEKTLAHEYTHSMQDAQHDIGALYDKWEESEAEQQGYTAYSETLSCLIEGDAELTERLYAEAVYGSDWEDLVAAERANEEPIDFDIPEFLLRAIYFNYSDCVTFVEALYENGGWDAVNAAYEDPPGTTEQILIIDKYFDDEVAGEPKPESIDAALPGWHEETDWGGQFGMFDIYNYILSRSGDYFGALGAAEGWDFGWIRVFRADGDSFHVAADVTLGFDTAADRTEFLNGFVGILESHGLHPDDVTLTDGVRRWHTPDEYDQYGALWLLDEGFGVRLIFAQDDATLDLFIAAD